MALLITRGGSWYDAKGREYGFVSGLAPDGVTRRRGTRPTPENTGTRATTLAPYTGPSAGGRLTITRPTRFEGIDFGNTRIRVQAPDVQFVGCRWLFTDFEGNSQAITFESTANTGGGLLKNCDVRSRSQIPSGVNGVRGWNFTLDRTQVEGFVDNVSIVPPGANPGNVPVGVQVIDSWIGPTVFYWVGQGGVVHTRDPYTHNDGVQWHGGMGSLWVNTFISGHVSQTHGTGTPGSGSEHADHDWFTQALGEQMRYEILTQNGQFATPGERGYLLGGSAAGMMFTPASGKGDVPDVEMAYCWGSGGAQWINAGTSSLQGPFGKIYGLRLKDDQRHFRQGVSIRAGVTVDMSDNEYVDDDWNPVGAPVTRRNG